MNPKRLLLYPCIIILALVITLLETKVLYFSNHYRTRVILMFEETQTYLFYGWLFFLPTFFFIYDTAFNNRWLRILILLAPVIIELVYYYIIFMNPTEYNEHKVYTGYLRYYHYCVDIVFSTLITCITSIIGVEIYFHNQKKNTQSSSFATRMEEPRIKLAPTYITQLSI